MDVILLKETFCTKHRRHGSKVFSKVVPLWASLTFCTRLQAPAHIGFCGAPFVTNYGGHTRKKNRMVAVSFFV